MYNKKQVLLYTKKYLYKSVKEKNYTKNETEVTIYKQEKETKKPLEGVTFNLLDSNKNIIHANLKTNKEGIVKLEDLMPGKYYLIETRNIIWVCNMTKK